MQRSRTCVTVFVCNYAAAHSRLICLYNQSSLQTAHLEVNGHHEEIYSFGNVEISMHPIPWKWLIQWGWAAWKQWKSWTALVTNCGWYQPEMLTWGLEGISCSADATCIMDRGRAMLDWEACPRFWENALKIICSDSSQTAGFDLAWWFTDFSPSEWLKLILNVTLCSMLLLFYLRLLLICPRVTCGLDWVVLMWFVIFDAKCRTEAWKEGKWECGKRVSECDCGFEECVIGCYFLDGVCVHFKVTWSKNGI